MTEADVLIIMDADGLRGTAEAAQLEDQDATEIWVVFEGRRVLVPRDQLVSQADDSYLLDVSLEEYLTETDMESETRVIPVVEETAAVRKLKRETGTVRILKSMYEEEEQINVPLVSEEVEITRVAIDRPIDGPVPVRQEGNTIILPLVEEVLVVRKQLVLKEEVHIFKKQTETEFSEQVTLRKERVTVERMDASQALEDEKRRKDV